MSEYSVSIYAASNANYQSSTPEAAKETKKDIKLFDFSENKEADITGDPPQQRPLVLIGKDRKRVSDPEVVAKHLKLTKIDNKTYYKISTVRKSMSVQKYKIYYEWDPKKNEFKSVKAEAIPGTKSMELGGMRIG